MSDKTMDLRWCIPEPAFDTRNTHRHRVYRPVLVETEGATGLCLVRDLSPGGLRAHVYSQFVVDQRVSVHFSTDCTVQGAICWFLDGQIGVQFDELIDLPALLSGFGKETGDAKINRSVRLPITCSARLTKNGRTETIEVQDISQRGVKVRAPFLQAREEVDLQLDGLAPRKAVVRWIQPGVAGLNFVRPLAFEELARWTAHQQGTLHI